MAAGIKIEEDAGGDGRRLLCKPDDLMVQDIEIALQKRLIKPGLIDKRGVSGQHVLDGHHSGKLRLIPVVDAGLDTLLVHRLSPDRGFHKSVQFPCHRPIGIEKELFAIGGVEWAGRHPAE